MKEKILQLLYDAEAYISGEEMSHTLGVSRTAIWKVINQLKSQGYEIESVTRKGYKLINAPDLLNKEELHYDLHTDFIGQEIRTYETLGSTNQEAKKLALEGLRDGTVVIANEQTAGKGRRGRSWVSPPGTGIWMTLLLRPDIQPQHASMVTLVAGLAVCEVIREVTGLEAEIKWPNDIVLNGKKICGLLTEMNSEIDYINFVVIGIGINVNVAGFPDELEGIATSLLLEGGQTYERKVLVKRILERFEKYYKLYLETEDLRHMIEAYQEHCVNIGREVRVSRKNEVLIGTVKKVSDKGELIVTDDNGDERLIHSGEVSVRGIYGYV